MKRIQHNPTKQKMNSELSETQISTLRNIWNRYQKAITDVDNECYVMNYVFLMKLLKCGSELSDEIERDQLTSLLNTLQQTINKVGKYVDKYDSIYYDPFQKYDVFDSLFCAYLLDEISV